eukprot:gene8955-3254_t
MAVRAAAAVGDAAAADDAADAVDARRGGRAAAPPLP